MNKIKKYTLLIFPTLHKKIYEHTLVYLDNASTSLIPWCVIFIIQEYHIKYSSNIQRGSYYLSSFINKICDLIRNKIAMFINSNKKDSIIYTKGSTDSINIIAHSFIYNHLKKKDEILISIMEHHSNFVPWQNISNKTNVALKFIFLNKMNELHLNDFILKITKKIKFISLTYISNVIGTINSICNIIKYIHEKKNNDFNRRRSINWA